MAVIGRDAKQRCRTEFCQADHVGNVPQLFDRRSGVVTELFDGRMAVEDFEMLLKRRVSKISWGNRIAKVGMVEMGQNRTASSLRLFADSPQVVLNRLADGLAADRLNRLGNVAGIDVDRLASNRVTDLFRWNQQELPSLLHKGSKLVERFEPNLSRVALASPIDPGRSKTVEVFRDHIRPTAIEGTLFRDPADALGQYIVVGEG